MAFDRTKISLISSYIVLMQGLFADANEEKDATDGLRYIRKLLNTESIPVNPAYLLFTAPYKICAGGCTGADKRPNVGLAFPVFLGEYGQSVYKQIYPNDKNNIQDLFKNTRPTRAPLTTCPPWTERSTVTANRNTRSTGYPGYSFEVNTKSTDYPGHETSTSRHDSRKTTRSTYYHGYSDTITETQSTHYHGYSDTITETQSTHYHGYSDTIKETPSTRIAYFKDFLNTRIVRPLGFQRFRKTQDNALPDYNEFKNIQELALREKPPRVSTIPRIYNQLEENIGDYTLQSQQEYTYRNSIMPNSRNSQAQKMQWFKISMMRKTINMATPAPFLMRRLAPLRRKPKNYQESITANLEARKRNEEWPFGFMPVLPIQ